MSATSKSRRSRSYCFDFAGEGLGFLLTRTISKDNVDTSPGKVHGDVTAEAAASARDDGDLVRHSSFSFTCHLLSSFDLLHSPCSEDR